MENAAGGQRHIHALLQELRHPAPQRCLQVGGLGQPPGSCGLMLGFADGGLGLDNLHVQLLGIVTQQLGVVPGLLRRSGRGLSLGQPRLGQCDLLRAGAGLHQLLDPGLRRSHGSLDLGKAGAQQAVVQGQERLAGADGVAFGHVQGSDAATKSLDTLTVHTSRMPLAVEEPAGPGAAATRLTRCSACCTKSGLEFNSLR